MALDQMTEAMESLGVEGAVAASLRAAWRARQESVFGAADYVEAGVGEYPGKDAEDPTEDDLKEAGLTEEELASKLAGFHTALDQWEQIRGEDHPPSTMRRAGRQVLRWGRFTVGSIKNCIRRNAKVRAALEALKEFIDMVNNVVDDADEAGR